MTSGDLSARARVERFFSALLPEAIRRQRDAFRLTRGTLSIFVEGAGAWCIQFGARAEDVIAEASFDADGVAVFTVDAFVALLDGDADARPATYLGDEGLLTQLGTLMQPPKRGALGVRIAAPIPKTQRTKRRNLDHVTHLP
ncbi:MAG: hypothetical protein RIT81_37035 [Deltaproteobacteria bacterium]